MNGGKDKNSFISNITIRLLPSEKVFLIYLLLTLMIIIPGYAKTQHFPVLLLVRICSFIFVILFAYFSKTKKGAFRNFYLLVFPIWFYGETGYFNNVLFNDLDNYLVIAEDWIFSCQPSLVLSQELKGFWFSELMHFGYFSFYLILFGFPLMLYLKKSPKFDLIIFIIINSLYCYYLFFAIFPTVGPQFWFPDSMKNASESGIFTFLVRLAQDIGETPTGAFPSSHIGATWLIVFLAAKYYKQALKFIIPVAIILSISTVYIRAHYVLDVFGGLISVPILYFFSMKLFSKFTNN